jgi:DNA-binding SARP family transcriptional activator
LISVAGVQVRLLGPLEVVDGNRRVEIGPRERRMLAVLALRPGQVASVDQIAEAVWPDKLPPSGSKVIQNLALRLRRALANPEEVPAIETVGAGYRLVASPGGIDVGCVENLADQARRAAAGGDLAAASVLLGEALAWWRGAPAQELGDMPAGVAEMHRLEELKLVLIEEKVEADLALGVHRQLVPDLERLVQEHPYREGLWRQLMVALYRGGRQAEALATFQRVRARLIEDLGVEPGPALRRTERAVLDHDPDLEPAPAARLERAAEPPPPLPGPLRFDGSFVGRTAQLDALCRAIEDALGGDRRVVLVSGEAGAGKTRLVAEAARGARGRGCRVLYGQGDEPVISPYEPLLGVCRVYFDQCGPLRLRDHSRSELAELSRLVPELAERVPGLPHHRHGDPDSERRALSSAVASVLVRASAYGGLVIVLDDLHWCDPAAIAVLRALISDPTPARLVIFGCFRDIETSPALDALVGDLPRRPGTGHVRLGPLTVGEVAELALLAADDDGAATPDLAPRLMARTGGNPFLVSALLDAARAGDRKWLVEAGSVPIVVRDMLARRLALLDPDSQHLLGLAAIAGVPVGIRFLRHFDNVPPDAVMRALDQALKLGILTDDTNQAGEYRFAHDLWRGALSSSHSPIGRMQQHRQVGEAIERFAAGSDRYLDLLAHHFLEAADDVGPARGADYAIAACRLAIDLLAFEKAAALADRSSEIVSRLAPADTDRHLRLQLLLAEAYEKNADIARCREAALAAADDARRLGRSEELAIAARQYATMVVGAGVSNDNVVPLCEEALLALGTARPDLRARLLSAMGSHLAVGQGLAEQARRYTDEALELSAASGDPGARSDALMGATLALLGHADLDRRHALVDELLAIGERSNDFVQRSFGWRFRAVACLERGDLAGFRADRARLASLPGTAGWVPIWLAVWAAMEALLEGRFADVNALAAAPLSLSGKRGDPSALSRYALQHFMLARETGNLDEVRPAVEAAAAGNDLFAYQAALIRIDAEAAPTQATEAISRLATEHYRAIPIDAFLPTTAFLLAEACTILRHPTAAVLYDRFCNYRGRLWVGGAGVVCFGAADRFLGMLAATAGRPDTAEAHLVSALAFEEQLGSPPLVARTRLELARLLSKSDPPRAVALATLAAREAQRMSMRRVAQEATELLDHLS